MGLVLSIVEQTLHLRDEENKVIPYSAMNPRVYMCLETEEGLELGTVDFRLSAATHPKLADNFCKLCTSTGGKGITNCEQSQRGKGLRFTGTPIHCVSSRQGLMAGGDVVFRNGSGGHAADGAFVEESAPSLKYDKPGALCMMSKSPESSRFDSQFFVVVDPFKVETLNDGLVFGHVEKGIDVLQAILASYGTDSGIPSKKILISDCGQY